MMYHNEALFLWTQDSLSRGCIVVVAKNEHDARELMDSCLNYDPEVEIERHNFEAGFTFCNLGDL